MDKSKAVKNNTSANPSALSDIKKYSEESLSYHSSTSLNNLNKTERKSQSVIRVRQRSIENQNLDSGPIRTGDLQKKSVDHLAKSKSNSPASNIRQLADPNSVEFKEYDEAVKLTYNGDLAIVREGFNKLAELSQNGNFEAAIHLAISYIDGDLEMDEEQIQTLLRVAFDKFQFQDLELIFDVLDSEETPLPLFEAVRNLTSEQCKPLAFWFANYALDRIHWDLSDKNQRKNAEVEWLMRIQETDQYTLAHSKILLDKSCLEIANEALKVENVYFGFSHFLIAAFSSDPSCHEHAIIGINALIPFLGSIDPALKSTARDNIDAYQSYVEDHLSDSNSDDITILENCKLALTDDPISALTENDPDYLIVDHFKTLITNAFKGKRKERKEAYNDLIKELPELHALGLQPKKHLLKILNELEGGKLSLNASQIILLHGCKIALGHPGFAHSIRELRRVALTVKNSKKLTPENTTAALILFRLSRVRISDSDVGILGMRDVLVQSMGAIYQSGYYSAIPDSDRQ